MANDTIQLRAEAKRLGVPDYRKMSTEELKSAIAKAKKGTGAKSGDKTAAPAKSAAKKSSGKKSPPKKSAAKSEPKKAADKSTAKKSAGKKSAKSAKSAPAGKSAKSGEAKRQTTGAKKSTAKAAPAKAAAKKAAPAKAKATDNETPGRNAINNKEIDWTQEWTGGKKGNRAVIFKAVKKYKGSVEKVFEALKGDARKMYPKNTKTGEKYTAEKARTLLRWHISRIKYDYVLATGQHEKSENRSGYGKSKAPQAAKRREERNGGKSTGASKSPAKAKAGKKSSAKAAGPQKGGQSAKKAPAKKAGKSKSKKK